MSSTHRFPVIARVAALGLALAVAPPVVYARRGIDPPPVPEKLEVGEDDVAFLVGHAIGTQNYICLPSGAGVAYALFTPQATLFNDNEQQVITHFFGPNPDEPGVAVRAAWVHSRDSSTVWGKVKEQSSDAPFVQPGAIPWLLVEVVGDEAGPTGGERLTATTVIHRVNTEGGVAPATGCAVPADIGAKAFVPYKADYFFYKHRGRDDD